MIKELCEETGETPTAIAAAMAELLQGDRPLDAPPPSAKKRREPPREISRQSAREKPREAATGERKKKRKKSDDTIDMETYRIEVGHEHEVTPGNIVGAIANEIDIDSQYIGGISIFDDHSTVELPNGMPADIYQHLRRVRVKGQQLNISLVGGNAPGPQGKKAGKPKKTTRKNGPPIKKPADKS